MARLLEMALEALERKGHYAVDVILPFSTSFIDRSIRFKANCDLTRVNVQYIDVLL